MPQPTSGDVHVNRPLTNLSVAFLQRQEQFVASRVFPVVGVAKQSDLFYTYDKNEFYRDEAKPRAPGTESAGGGFTPSTDTYSCLVEAYHKDVDDQTRTNADTELALDRAAMEFTALKLMIRRERRFMSKFFTSGIWTTDITPGTLWSAANSTPQDDVETGKAKILGDTGYLPNTLVLGWSVFSKLRTNAQVKDQFKYTSADSITAGMLAGFFDVERVLVASGTANTAAEGATASLAIMAGKNALLCYAAPAPALMAPSAGYTFSWSGYTGAVDGVRVKQFRMEHLGADRIEMEQALDFKKVSAQLGYFFASVVS